MKKSVLFALVLGLIHLSLESRILQISSFEEILPSIDQHTWVLVDLDDTLFEAKTALGHASWFNDEVGKRMDTGMSRHEAIADFYPSWLAIQSITEVKPMDEHVVPSLRSLQAKGVTVMGLTHRQPPIVGATLRQIASLGIDFCKTAPELEDYVVEAPHPTLYTKGILFVSDYNCKGEVLKDYLITIQKYPKRVVFIDGSRRNLESVDAALARLGIPCLGFHYTAINEKPSVYSRELADFQLKQLQQIISNDKASQLLNTGSRE